MSGHDGSEWRPPFDLNAARAMIGKRLLIGLTVRAHDESLIERQQMHGRIFAVDHRGIGVQLTGARDGETYWLPPDMRSFQIAPKGEYRLRETGEVVRDPDLMTTWIVTKPAPGTDGRS
jgi:hypothetical protein